MDNGVTGVFPGSGDSLCQHPNSDDYAGASAGRSTRTRLFAAVYAVQYWIDPNIALCWLLCPVPWLQLADLPGLRQPVAFLLVGKMVCEARQVGLTFSPQIPVQYQIPVSSLPTAAHFLAARESVSHNVPAFPYFVPPGSE